MFSKKVHFGIVSVSAISFFALSILFKYILSFSDLIVVRPASALLPVFGLLFGFWGALGCAVGNLLLDLVSGTNLFMCFLSFFIQFATSYMTYVIWYSHIRKKEKLHKAEFPSLSKSSNVIRYAVSVVTGSAFCGLMIGFLTVLFGSQYLFGNRTIIVFFNQFIFGILLGFPLLALLTKCNLPFVTPNVVRIRKFRKLRKSLFVLSIALSVLAIVGIFAGVLLFEMHNYDYNTMLGLFVVIVSAACCSLFFRPLYPCKNAKIKNSGIITLNEKMVIIFTMFGVIISGLIGFMGYCEHSKLTNDMLHIWEEVCGNISFAMLCYFALAVAALKYMEKNITFPVNEISDAVSRYDTDNYSQSSTRIIKKCRELENKKSEISEMSKSIGKMITDIGVYTEDIKRKTEERQRVKAELEISSKIQLGIIPHNFDDFLPLGAEIYADMIPAKIVGGDFYDFFKTEDGKIAVVIADVSGKGMPAALFMSTTKTVIDMFLANGRTPAEALTRANKYICEHNSADMFVTAFAALYDPKNGELTYANAGHNPPVLCRGGNPSFMKIKPGFMLGSLDFIVYQQEKIILNNNDTLFLYTDGITEENNRNGEFFGESRLLDALGNSEKMNSFETVNAVIKSAYEFSDGAEQFDDMTMLVLKPKFSEKKSLTVEAKVGNLPEVLTFVTQDLPENRDCGRLKNDLELICEEIFVNICNYAYGGKTGKANIVLEKGGGRLTVSFSDKGTPFNPLEREDADISSPLTQRSIGGLGIHLVKNLTDELSYNYTDGMNVLTFVKNFDK